LVFAAIGINSSASSNPESQRMTRSQQTTTSLSCVLIACLSLATTAVAQITAGSGYTVARLAGDNDLGQHFSFARASDDSRVGFFYFADRTALYSASCIGSSCTVSGALTNTGNRGQFVSAAALPGAFNRPLVAYYDATNQDLRVGICSSSNSCNGFSADRVLDSAGDVGQHTAMAINPVTGFAVMSYYVATAGVGDARLYVCSNAECSTGSASTIATAGNVGLNSAIAFGANLSNFTNLFVVHDDQTSGQVRFERGVAPFTSFGGIDLGAGSDPAIDVGSSGFPDIVYRSADDRLVHVRCLSFDCSGANQVTQTLAAAGKGFAPSITRLPNGNAFITAQEQASGTLFGYVCNDAVCAAPQVLTIETGPSLGGVSIASSYVDGRPLAFYQDALNKDVRAYECTTPACAAFQRRITANGIGASAPNFALRGNGSAVAIWLQDRTPVIGVCNDLNCNSVTERATGGANTDVRPAIAVRPDGRPFAYYTAVGGTAAWDCADTNCTTGLNRFVSGSGNSTSNISELALRSDGTPVMLYYRNTTNEVFLYVCSDVNCTSGTSRLLITEPTVNSTTLSAFALAVGTDNRAIVSYLRYSNNFALVERRLLRCADVACTTASASNLATNPRFSGATPIALQSNGNLGFIEFSSSNANLIRCNDADCSSFGTTALPVTINSSLSLRFKATGQPIFDAGSRNDNSGFFECATSSCLSATFNVSIVGNAATPTQFSGPLALGADDRPAQILDETRAQDVWLAIPISNSIFRNGFE
jgi:hypothetical protein